MSSAAPCYSYHSTVNMNNLNGNSNVLKTVHVGNEKIPSKLSPRVMLGVELNILKPTRGAGFSHPTSAMSPMLPCSSASSSRGSVHESERSITPPASVCSSHRSEYSTRFEHQLQAYVLWINSQLKKKHGARLVEDLRHDCKDGTAFIDLISVIAGESISGVHAVPSNYAQMKENIERVLHFMSSKRIRMHHVMAKDIVEGNLKSIMRLILALAAHYKPKSVRHSTHNTSQSSSGSKSPNVTTIAQGASAALTAARRTVAKAGNSFRRKGRDYRHSRRHYHQESSSDQCSDSDTSFHADHPRIIPGRERGDVGDGASAGSSPTSSSIYSPQTSMITSTSSVGLSTNISANVSPAHHDSPVIKSKSAEHISHKESGISEVDDSVFTPGRGSTVQKSQYDDLMSDYHRLAEAMSLIKKELSRLQDLLLSGQPPDGEESNKGQMVEGSTSEEQIVILKSQLQQSKEMCSELREELSKSKIELMQTQGVKAGLQQRINDQETTIAQLKAELLRKDLQKQNVDSEQRINDQDTTIVQLKAELLRKDLQKQNVDSEQANSIKRLHDRDKTITDLKRDISRRDQRIDSLQHELQLQITEKEEVTRALRSQVKELSDKFRVVDETGATLKARVATQDKQMARLAGRILSTKSEPHRVTSSGNEELNVLQDSLNSLRQNFTPTDAHQHTIDTIEQGISTLIERLSDTGLPVSKSSLQNSSDQMVSRKLNFDGTGDVRRSPITAIPGSKQASFNPRKLEDSPVRGLNITKVLYFMESSTTPAMLTIHKRLGEITLHDFKGAFDRTGPYRYHFKALDPEFGTVKEEISNEDAIIPGWEGKIVAWIELDTGQ